MPQLEFIDCPHCKKRVASTARICRHCGNSPKGDHSIDESDDGLESHHASSFGGYDDLEDDFDYDEFISQEFPDSDRKAKIRNRWKYVSIMLLFVFVFLLLVQIYYVIAYRSTLF
jgi:hypothetical protein